VSLDEIIKNERRTRGGRGGRSTRGSRAGRGGRSGRDRQQRGLSGPIRVVRTVKRFNPYNSEDSPFTRRQPKADTAGRWQHDLYEANEAEDVDSTANSTPTTSHGGKIRITNLHYSVREEDLIELMKDVGTIVSCRVFYDNSGRSLEEAEIVFRTKAQAEEAIRKYNGSSVEGQAMSMTLVPLSRNEMRSSRARSRSNRTVSSRRGARSSTNRANRTRRGGRGRRGRRGRGSKY
jgi:hypothetical protein